MINKPTQETACNEQMQIIHAQELPLSCPTDTMALWQAHPKVYLPIEKSGHVKCPYCGTHYILQYE